MNPPRPSLLFSTLLALLVLGGCGGGYGTVGGEVGYVEEPIYEEPC